MIQWSGLAFCEWQIFCRVFRVLQVGGSTLRGTEYIALFTDLNGERVDVEKGANPPTDLELESSEYTVIHYIGEDNEDVYFSVLGGFDVAFDPVDAIMAKQGTTSRVGKKYPAAYPGE